MRFGREQISFAIVALVAMAVAAPAAAHPPAPVSVHGRPITGKFHRWLHKARAPLVHGRVQLAFGACPRHSAFNACVFGDRPRRIYMKRRLPGARRILYHELGHVFDLTALDDRERRSFKRIMHLGRLRWFGGVSPAGERFADGYSLCALGHRLSRATIYGYRPSRRQQRAVCRLIVRAAAPRGRAPQPPRNAPAVVEPPEPPQEPAPPPDSCGMVQSIFGCSMFG